jgi:hypothetical protein
MASKLATYGRQLSRDDAPRALAQLRKIRANHAKAVIIGVAAHPGEEKLVRSLQWNMRDSAICAATEKSLRQFRGHLKQFGFQGRRGIEADFRAGAKLISQA